MNNSILEDTRLALGLNKDSTDFDADLIIHINSAIGKLGQNGVTKVIMVDGVSQTWNDLQDPLKIKGNEFFTMVPSFITLSTKLIFDPPPPSIVDYYKENLHELLWRLKIAYEEPLVKDVTIQ